MKKILLTAIFVTLFLSVGAIAQTVFVPRPPVVYIPQLDPVRMYLQNNLFQQMMRTAGNQNNAKGAKNGARVKAAPAAIDYTVFNQREERYLPKLLAQSIKGDAGEQREAEQFFNSQIELYEKTALYYKYPWSDVAYALEYFISNNYEIYYDLLTLPRDKDPYLKPAKNNVLLEMDLLNRKNTAKISSIQDRSMYFQIKDMLSAKPEFRKITDEQKQMMTEALAIKMGLTHARYMKAVEDENIQAIGQAHKEARENLESLLGVPLERIKILDDGLRFQ